MGCCHSNTIDDSAIPVLGHPLQSISSKDLIIYTSNDDPSTVLKAPVQLVLTVTPVDQSKLFKSQTPVAWKVLAFDGTSDTQHKVHWKSSTGFATATVDADNVIAPGVHTSLTPRSWVQLNSVSGKDQWMKSSSLDSPDDLVKAKNSTGVPHTLALGSVDAGGNFEPFIHFKSTPNGEEVAVGPAVMLQIYAVSGYKHNQLLSMADADKTVLNSRDGTAEPIDLKKLHGGAKFLLYSDHTGKVAIRRS